MGKKGKTTRGKWNNEIKKLTEEDYDFSCDRAYTQPKKADWCGQSSKAETSFSNYNWKFKDDNRGATSVTEVENPELLDYNTHLPEMECYMKEAIEELCKQGILTEEDGRTLTYCPLEETECQSSSSEAEGSFPYPGIPLCRQLANLIEEWMFSGPQYAAYLKTYEHLDEGDGVSRRKMVMDMISCHMMSLRSAWDGLEEDMKRHKMVQLLKDIGRRGMLDLLGVRRTVGSKDVFPPTRDVLEASFRNLHKPNSQLTVGARALAKHCHRDESANWWGSLTGSEKAKNENAERVLKKILNDVGWLNIHQLPHALPILEVRNMDGYGARWSPDGTEFRGFLEPPMLAGWETGYKH